MGPRRGTLTPIHSSWVPLRPAVLRGARKNLYLGSNLQAYNVNNNNKKNGGKIKVKVSRANVFCVILLQITPRIKVPMCSLEDYTLKDAKEPTYDV